MTPAETEKDQVSPEVPEQAEPELEVPAKGKAKEEKTAKTFYFRNRKFAGESFENATVFGARAPRFTPFWEKYAGERVKIGYMATSDSSIAKRCREKPYVEELTAKEYLEATDTSRAKSPARMVR